MRACSTSLRLPRSAVRVQRRIRDAPVKDTPVKRDGPAIVCKKKALGKENVGAAQRPMKKLKLSAEPVKSVKGAGAGVLKGRPILRDLVENET